MAGKADTSYAPPVSKPQIGVALLMITGLVILSIVAGQLEAKPPAPPAAAVATPTPAEAAEKAAAPAPAPEKPAAPAATEVLTGEVKELKSRIDGLVTQVKGIQGSVVAPLAEKVTQFDRHVSDVAKKIEGLGSDLAALKKEVVTIAAAKATKSEDPPTPAPPSANSDVAMGEAITLFKQEKYKDALERFRKLTESDAKDARPWYFAALSTGLVTKNWTGGDAVSYVTKGVEREKAGSPAPEKIDAVFADLSPHTGRDWLSYYRKTAK